MTGIDTSSLRSAPAPVSSGAAGIAHVTVETEVRILGPVEVVVGSRRVVVGGRRARAVLAHLARSTPRWTTAERLADAAWGDDQLRNPRKAVQMHVVRLRRLLGESVVESGPPGHYRLGPTWTRDADRFLVLARRARAELDLGDGARARATADAALALWRGEPWSDLDDDIDALAEREALAITRDDLERVRTQPGS
jgi:DNA-binding SARP family transcriptional activator